MTDRASDSLSVKLVQNNYGQTVGVKLDYIDFMLILHEGAHKNTAFFENLLDSMEKIQNEDNDEND